MSERLKNCKCPTTDCEHPWGQQSSEGVVVEIQSLLMQGERIEAYIIYSDKLLPFGKFRLIGPIEGEE